MTILPQNTMSIDLEDWFHVFYAESIINRSEWNQKETKIRKMTDQILEIFHEHNIVATFFCIGWLADHYPELVREIHSAGHNIANHSYWHREVFKLTREEFKEDVMRAQNSLEDTIGAPVYGFRAPGYSIRKSEEWALDILADAGFRYDSSILYGGNHSYEIRPGLIEIPPTSVSNKNNFYPSGGGFFFRAIPFSFYKLYFKTLNSQKTPLNFYIHSWELYTDYPRLDLGITKSFIQYFNLPNTKNKLIRLLKNFEFTSIENAYKKQLSIS